MENISDAVAPEQLLMANFSLGEYEKIFKDIEDIFSRKSLTDTSFHESCTSVI